MANEFEQKLMEQAERATSRPVYSYKFKKDIADKTGINSIGLVELTMDEMLLVLNRCGNNSLRFLYEAPLESIRKANGQKITTVDGSSDRIWNALGEKGRQYVIGAYGKIHTPDASDMKDFLADETVEVG
jgi:hypothetical protein